MKRWISVLALSAALAAMTLPGCGGGTPSSPPAGTPASGGSAPDEQGGDKPPKEPDTGGGYGY